MTTDATPSTAAPAEADRERETAAEQTAVAARYARLDDLRRRTADELAAVHRSESTGTHQNRSERDAFAALHEARLAQLQAVEDRLVFGRLDMGDGETRYVGRLGLADEAQDRLLVDWRAPASEPFYQATAARPAGVARRRHLSLRGRDVATLEDDVLDAEGVEARGLTALGGEGALMAALGAQRTGRMGDIVATIQAEQDAVIRADAKGVLVVQGGPGTGKTAVALHRAAYLLYAHRDRLARSGVLVVGPSPVFLRYIEQVLPSLGENGVLTSTAGRLFPGVDARATDRPAVARLKGDERWLAVLPRAVAARQRVPAGPQRLDVEGTTVTLQPRVVARARDRARAGGEPHNDARAGFVKELLLHLADAVGRAQGNKLEAEDRPAVVADLRASRDVRVTLNLAWMPMSPQKLLGDLLTRPHRLLEASEGIFTDAERALLARSVDAPWTVDDVPLLDEAAELLGDDAHGDAARSARASEKAREEALAYAQDVIESGAGTTAVEGYVASAEDLAERNVDGGGPSLTVAERAAGDRTWVFGHVVVDEAQELSPLMWRLLVRRCPSRSMTVVGDLAQTRSAAGASAWGEALDPFAEGRWRLEELTVNYRTPRQVMDAAAAVLAVTGAPGRTPDSVREGEGPPVLTELPAPGAAREALLRDVVVDEAARARGGRLAVLVPPARVQEVAAALVGRVTGPDGAPLTVSTGATALEDPVVVMAVADSKGLEFDSVVLVEPAELLDGPEGEDPRAGAHDLYVAMTRPTQRLHVLASPDLDPALARALVGG
ncbi:HelD family protein [Pseudokineococcus lusitanus]|uniref:DNA helicase IV n=1 Tax=Pseudokineococcus lusitanus TaxID=763993 RepID=A0A3N1HTY2_9ACTN|nr:AAA family ATPase [Pseudokineococcus lusitanus]ROP45993.1 DNA helicase IV [Pseudokineococcus lusitanus]